MILLLEDDESLNRGISLKLQKEGYDILSASGVAEARELFETHKIELVISDITVKDGNGLDFCREVRQKSNAFILFLTALDQEIDIVNGYDAGADDYITKPFSLMVLLSKVNAFMRRAETTQCNLLSSGDISVHCKEMKVYRADTEVVLSKKEFQILLFLMEHAKQVVSKEQVLESIWDKDGQFVNDNTVAVNISRLRGKLAEAEQTYIKNVRGIGYIWTTDVLTK